MPEAFAHTHTRKKLTRKIINPYLIMTFDIYIVLFDFFKALYTQ